MKKTSKTLLPIIGEIDLVYTRKVSSRLSDRPVVSSSEDACNILRQYWNDSKLELLEEFKVLLLNRSNRVLGLLSASSGGLTGTVADPRLILIAALKAAACSIILAHNHPSGSANPSNQDKELTAKIKGACNFLDIKLLDHIILTSEGYLSFADEGLL